MLCTSLHRHNYLSTSLLLITSHCLAQPSSCDLISNWLFAENEISEWMEDFINILKVRWCDSTLTASRPHFSVTVLHNVCQLASLTGKLKYYRPVAKRSQRQLGCSVTFIWEIWDWVQSSLLTFKKWAHLPNQWHPSMPKVWCLC